MLLKHQSHLLFSIKNFSIFFRTHSVVWISNQDTETINQFVEFFIQKSDYVNLFYDFSLQGMKGLMNLK